MIRRAPYKASSDKNTLAPTKPLRKRRIYFAYPSRCGLCLYQVLDAQLFDTQKKALPTQ